MKTEFRQALLPREIRSLVAFDRAVFSESDSFHPSDWASYKSIWMIVEGTKVGCCAFQEHVEFQQDIRSDQANPKRKGSLYIVTTGILPPFQGRGFGSLLKAYQVAYAKRKGFTRIITNTRKRNGAMLALNLKYDFQVVRTTPKYYSDPIDSTVVMELRLGKSRPG